LPGCEVKNTSEHCKKMQLLVAYEGPCTGKEMKSNDDRFGGGVSFGLGFRLCSGEMASE